MGCYNSRLVSNTTLTKPRACGGNQPADPLEWAGAVRCFAPFFVARLTWLAF